MVLLTWLFGSLKIRGFKYCEMYDVPNQLVFLLRPLAGYNSLTDPHLAAYFTNRRIRRHLRKSGLVSQNSEPTLILYVCMYICMHVCMTLYVLCMFEMCVCKEACIIIIYMNECMYVLCMYDMHAFMCDIVCMIVYAYVCIYVCLFVCI